MTKQIECKKFLLNDLFKKNFRIPEDDKRPYKNVLGKHWNLMEEIARLSDIFRGLVLQFQNNLTALYNYLTDQLETIRRSKKLNFRMKTHEIMILSTIHSFKGWEIHTLFLILEGQEEDQIFITYELVYTAITRARFNILILNLGMMKYHQFFESSIRTGT